MTAESTAAGGVNRNGTDTFSATELTASLTVKDIRKGLAWYRDVVGFTPAASRHRTT
jgi:hypothetical protein